MKFQVIEYGSAEYEESVRLRDKILRKPLGLEFNQEHLAAESDSYHLVGVLAGAIRACCIAVSEKDGRFKIRQVAVDDGFQRRGFGEQLMEFAEQQVKQLGGGVIYCNSREVAKSFYEKLGYQSVGPVFEEVGIAHIRMEKNL